MKPTRINDDKNHPAIQLWRGFAVRETGSSAAVVNFRLASATGDILWPLNLAADEAAGIIFDGGEDAIESTAGVYVEVVSGAIVGTLFS